MKVQSRQYTNAPMMTCQTAGCKDVYCSVNKHFHAHVEHPGIGIPSRLHPSRVVAEQGKKWLSEELASECVATSHWNDGSASQRLPRDMLPNKLANASQRAVGIQCGSSGERGRVGFCRQLRRRRSRLIGKHTFCPKPALLTRYLAISRCPHQFRLH